MEESKENHVVMFPYLAKGHFIPFITLAKMLSAQDFTVTLLTTTANASTLQSYLRADSNIHLVYLPLPPVDGLPPHCQSTDTLSPSESILLFSSCQQLSAPFESWLKHLIVQDISQKPLCIISDVFHCYWLVESASKLGIPCLAFHTTGALGASVLQYLFSNPVDDIVGERQIIEICDHCMDITLRRAEVPIFFRSECINVDFSNSMGLLRQSYVVAKESCTAMLVNTFQAIEGAYVRYLQETTGKPVWAVASTSHTLAQGKQILHHESDCIRWLHSRKPRSVLYISFGSQAFLSEDQIQALAKGIEASKQPFLWTIKDLPGSNINFCDFLPEGFVEETRDRGMVIRGWVPQKLILSHPSIAGFMSHCGWNSTVESICAGVPMVAWPMAFEQSVNAKLVVEEFRMGLRMCEGDDQVPCRNVVESTVKAAMGEEMHKRAQDIKESIQDGTSCEQNIRDFVCFIGNLCKR